MPRRPRQLALPRTSTWGGARPGTGRSCGRIVGRSFNIVGAPNTGLPSLCTSRCEQGRAFLRCGCRKPLRPCGTRSGTRRPRASASCISPCRAIISSLIVEAEDTSRSPRDRRAHQIRIGVASTARSRVACGFGRPLPCPRLANAARGTRGLIYVLQNWKKHIRNAQGLDGRSSAPWFDGWMERPAPPPGHAPVVSPRTWLASIGWRRCAGGPLRPHEEPTRT